MRRFLEAAGKPAGEVGEADVRAFLLRAMGERVSIGYQRQAIAAIRFLFAHVLKRPGVVRGIPLPERERTLPIVLARDEVRRILAAAQNPKHRLVLSLIYAAGLRLGEAARLRVGDVDVHRRMLHVRGGKGLKDRYTLLSDAACRLLESYPKPDDPRTWIFPGTTPGRHLHPRSIQNAFQQACRRGRHHQSRHRPHAAAQLRDAPARAGTGLRHIQELLGHSSSRTTEIYTHVSSSELRRIRSPLDEMDGP